MLSSKTNRHWSWFSVLWIRCEEQCGCCVLGQGALERDCTIPFLLLFSEPFRWIKEVLLTHLWRLVVWAFLAAVRALSGHWSLGLGNQTCWAREGSEESVVLQGTWPANDEIIHQLLHLKSKITSLLPCLKEWMNQLNLCSSQNIMMANNYNPTVQGSGNWCIAHVSWEVNDSNSAFICEMLSMQSLVLNGKEIWLFKEGHWHPF